MVGWKVGLMMRDVERREGFLSHVMSTCAGGFQASDNKPDVSDVRELHLNVVMIGNEPNETCWASIERIFIKQRYFIFMTV